MRVKGKQTHLEINNPSHTRAHTHTHTHKHTNAHLLHISIHSFAATSTSSTSSSTSSAPSTSSTSMYKWQKRFYVCNIEGNRIIFKYYLMRLKNRLITENLISIKNDNIRNFKAMYGPIQALFDRIRNQDNVST